jgi:hypothetical protein
MGVFQSRVLRRMFVPGREVTEGRRGLHNEYLLESYSSTIKIKMIRLRRMSWDGVGWIVLVQEIPVEEACEQGNGPSGSIRCWELLQYLHNWRPLDNEEWCLLGCYAVWLF